MANTQRQKVRAKPAARGATIFIGLLLVALGALAAREQWWVHRGDNDAQAWVTPALESIGSATYQDWMMPVGFTIAVVGLFFLIVAIRGRRTTHVALHLPEHNAGNQDTAASTMVWFARPIDIARLCTAAALDTPGTESAQTAVNRKAKKVTVYVTPAGASTSEAELRQQVDEAIAPIVARLPKQPKTKIVVRRAS